MNFKTFGIIALVFTLGLVSYWGYNQYTAGKDIESELNNRYENAFQGLNHNIDALEAELGTVMVSKAADNLSVNLSNIWRTAYSAQEDLGQLPVSDSSLNNIKLMLHKVLQYTNHLDKKVADGGLTEEDKNSMKSFYTQVVTANKNLEKIHDNMDRKKFKWYDKKRVKMDSNSREYSASPLSGLAELDKKLNLDNIQKDLEKVLPKGSINLEEEDIITNITNINGRKVDQDQSIEIAKKFIKNPNNYKYEIIDQQKLKVKGKSVKTSLPAHSIQATNKKDKNEVAYLDIAKKGGNVIWLLNQRDTKEKKIGDKEAVASAVDFLKQNGFGRDFATSSKSFNDITVISLAPIQDDVIIKPDAISLEVALDNGEILGFNGIDYLLNHKDRSASMLKPKLSMAEAKEKVSNNLKIKEGRLVIDQHGSKEVLCYEFIGSIGRNGDANYRVHINSLTGREEVVKGVDDDFYKNVN